MKRAEELCLGDIERKQLKGLAAMDWFRNSAVGLVAACAALIASAGTPLKEMEASGVVCAGITLRPFEVAAAQVNVMSRTSTLRAFQIADEAMFELLLAHCAEGAGDIHLFFVNEANKEVRSFSEASSAIWEAIKWLNASTGRIQS